MTCQPRDFLVRLRDSVELDVKAQTPERACEIVAGLHPALGSAIIAAGTDEEMILLRGRCVKCDHWVLSSGLDDLGLSDVMCGVCRAGALRQGATRALAPNREMRRDRKGGPDGSTGDRFEDPEFWGRR